MNKIIPLEDIEQQNLITWCRLHPICKDYIFAIPNGGTRNKAEAAKLKRTGVKPGIPDLFLAFPSGDYHGLFIEMKRRKGSVTSIKQKEVIERFRYVGYKAVICKGWDYAAMEIQKYLDEGYEGYANDA